MSQLHGNNELIVKPKLNANTMNLEKPQRNITVEMQQLIDNSYQRKKRESNLQCPQCTNNYSSEKSLYCHIRLVHKGEYHYECNKCGRRFLNKHHYATHVRLHLKILRFKWNVCGRKFVRQPLLRHHLLSDHGGKYPCPHCEREYCSSKALRMHLKDVSKKYQCPLCSKMFASFNSCRRHIKNCK